MLDETLLFHGEVAAPEDFLKDDAMQHSEIEAAFIPAQWVEKNLTTGFITYPKRNQQLQGTCTCYSIAKALSIDELSENGNWRELSPHSLYPYFVQPGGGANSLVAAQAACKQGMTLEQLFPTDGLNELQVESSTGYAKDAKQVAVIYAPQNIVQCASDFETIASILSFYQSQGIKKGVLVTVVGCNNSTWYNMMPVPPADPSQGVTGNWYHKIIVTDFGLINGKKVLAFDNSWGELPGNKGQQFLTEEYQVAMYGAFYTLNQPDDWMTSDAAKAITKPVYNWSVDLHTGSNGPDVLALQKALQCIGMFPVSSVVAPTGAFFGITKQAVLTFQASFGLSQTGIVDEETRIALNNIFKA